MKLIKHIENEQGIFYEKQFNPNIILDSCFTFADDTLAERLRRRPAKPMGSPRVGSNPTGVVFEILERGAARAAQDTMHPENMVDVALQFPTEIAKAKQQQQMKGKDGCMQLVCCGLVA